MMRKGENFNHPREGSSTRVDPIRKLKDIETILTLINDSPRDTLLFLMGINNGLRCGDLLALRVGQVLDLRPGSSIIITEQKTKKPNVLMINKTVYTVLQRYLNAYQPNNDDYLFKSRKGANQPLSIQAVNNMIKRWAAAINLKGNFGSHTLRKTWGYLQRTKFGVSFEVLTKRFKHASPIVTMRYLGIEDREVNDILLNEIG